MKFRHLSIVFLLSTSLQAQSLRIVPSTNKLEIFTSLGNFGLVHIVPGVGYLAAENNATGTTISADMPDLNFAVGNGPASIKLKAFNLEFPYYTKLGDLAPFIKTKLFTGTTAPGPGSSASSTILHGLNYTKILSVSVFVSVPQGLNPAKTIPEEYTFEPGYLYSYAIDALNITIYNRQVNSSNIYNMPFAIHVVYEQ
jgi:hypothetical protein